MASKQAQVPITAEKIRKCTIHPHKDISMSCDTCSDQLVCTRCVVTDHKTHTFRELEDLVDKKRVSMTEFVKSSGKQLGKLQSIFEILQNLKQTVSDNSKTLEDSVEKRMKELQQQLNEIANNVKEEHRTKVEKNVKVIEARIEFVTCLQQEISESLTKCQAALESQSVWEIIDFQLDSDSNEKLNNELTQVPQVSKYDLTFHDKKLSDSVFGTLTEKKDSDVKGNKESCRPPKSTKEASYIEPTLLQTCQHFCLPTGGINAICILNKDEAWISYISITGTSATFHPTIHHVTQKGDIIATAELDSLVTCLQLSSDKSLLASCEDNKIRCLTPDGKMTVLFECHGYTYGFCEVGKRQDIVACLKKEGRVVKYSREGRVLQSLSSCIEKPINISASKVTGEMVIIDQIEKGHKKLVVADSKMNFLWEVDTWQGTPLEGIVDKFRPNQTCYDNEGNILAVIVYAHCGFVIKIKNKKVHSFKRIGSIGPYSIDIEDEMWIGMGTGDVIIMSSDI